MKKIIALLTLICILPTLNQIAGQDRLVLDEPTIQFQKLELDFLIMGTAMDEVSQKVVIWGSKEAAVDTRPQRANFYRSRGPHELAVYDLQTHQLVVKTFEGGIRNAAIDQDSVYVLSLTPKLIYRLSNKTLEMQKRNMLEEDPGKLIQTAPNKKLLLANHIVDRKTLEVTAAPLAIDRFRRRLEDESPGVPLSANQSIQQNQVVDSTTGELIALIAPPKFQNLADPIGPMSLPRTDTFEPAYLGRRSIRGQWWNSADQPIINFRTPYGGTIASTAFSSRHRLVFVFRRVDSRRAAPKILLNLRNLTEGELVESFLVDNIDDDTLKSPLRSSFCGENHLLLVSDRKLLRFAIPDVNEEKTGTPLHLVLERIDPWNADEPKKFKLDARGGKGQLEFELLRKYPGIELDSKTGDVTIDTPRILADYMSEKSKGLSQQTDEQRRRFFDSLEKVARPEYKRIYGQDLAEGQIPFWLPVYVRVSDESGDQSNVAFYLTVTANVPVLNEMIAADKKDRRRHLISIATIHQRMNELEPRIGEMEKSIDAILKSLEKLLDEDNQ